MVESSIFEKMIDYASLNENDVALDIGAGLGFLTLFLANKCKHVLAIEVDREILEVLTEQVSGLKNVKIISGNVLRIPIPPFSKVISIPPYQISSHLVPRFFDLKFNVAVLMFQREFAERLVAAIGSDSYGWLSVTAYYHFNCEILDEVPKSMFYPQPEVSSAIVRLTPKSDSPFDLGDGKMFTKLVRSLFTQRNRKVSNALVPFLKGMCKMDARSIAEVVAAVPFNSKRVRELAPEDFGVLANVIFK